MSTLTDDQLRALHQKAKHHLKVKVGNIPTKLFGRKKPTLRDIYFSTTNIVPRGVPSDLDLSFVFEHYDEIRRSGFKINDNTSPKLTRALIFWRLDIWRSICADDANTRYNVMVMCWLWSQHLAGRDISQYITVPNADTFIHAFVLAFMHHLRPYQELRVQENFIETRSELPMDVLFFNSSERKKIKKTIKSMCLEKLSEDRVLEITSFLENGDKLSPEEMMKDGPKLAMAWAMLLSKRREQQLTDDMMDSVADLLGGMTTEDVDEDALDDQVDLTTVEWDKPIIRALLTDFDESIPLPTLGQMPQTQRQPWIAKDVAMGLLTTTVGEIADLLGNMNI